MDAISSTFPCIWSLERRGSSQNVSCLLSWSKVSLDCSSARASASFYSKICFLFFTSYTGPIPKVGCGTTHVIEFVPQDPRVDQIFVDVPESFFKWIFGRNVLMKI